MPNSGLTTHEVLRFASVIAVGVTLMLTASASYFLERRHGQRPIFALTLMLIAWSTFTLGAAMSGVGRFFPSILVMAPILSGYAGPAIYIYTRRLTTPHATPTLRWFWLGTFGTTYSVLALTIPNGLDYATQAIMHQAPYWHPVLSPFMTLQSIQLVGFVVVSTVLITRTFWKRARPDLRRTQFWLLITCWSCLSIVVLTNILPTLKISLTDVEPALMTLPIALVGLLSVRALGKELETLHAGHNEIKANRMESLGRMARGLAHDLNNILTAVVMHAELAKLKVKGDADAESHLTQIMKDSERAAELLNRMMAYSGRVNLTKSAVNPRGPIEAAFHSTYALKTPACSMNIDLAPDLPEVRIDGASLASTIENLLSNSVHAMEERSGQITLRAFCEQDPKIPLDAVGETFAGDAAVRIEVEDTGRGMSAAEASRALEPFYSGRRNGKGLGLVSVLSNVKGAGGVLWFSSEEDVGTRFVIWLPLATVRDSKSPSPCTSVPLTALLVDDEAEITNTLSQILGTFGVESVCFASAEDALLFIEQPIAPTFSFAMVDVRLGAMDGIELGHRLLHDQGIPAIVLMSGDEPGPRLEQFNGYAAVFIRKPINTGKLESALEDLGLTLRPQTNGHVAPRQQFHEREVPTG